MSFKNDSSFINITKIVSQLAFPDPVSYFVREIVLIFNLVFLGQIVGSFGTAGNIVNIIVFIKHGFNDTINISLVSLSLADMGALISMQWFIICVNPYFLKADLPFLPLEIQSLTAGYPHVYFTRVTSFITAFISFERCVCVVFPLHVKKIITKRFVIVYNIVTFHLLIVCFFPVYYTAYYDWKFDKISNKSKIGIFYTSEKDEILAVSLMITNFIIPLLTFVIIITSTIITGIILKQKSKWRQTSSVGFDGTKNNISTKEKKVVVMITAVSVLFVILLLPISLILSVRAVVPGLSINGQYANMNWMVVSIALLMEMTNSSISCLIFYKMSSKYRETIHEMFRLAKKTL
jgi:hypothetical protein